MSYIASAGHKLGGYVNPNQPLVIISDPSFRGAQAPNQQMFPFPQWGSVRSASFEGNSIYNSLVVSGKWQGGAAKPQRQTIRIDGLDEGPRERVLVPNR